MGLVRHIQHHVAKQRAQAARLRSPVLRWRLHLRAQLGRHYTLLSAGEDDGLSGAGPARPGRFTLRIELEEFSQLFTAPDNSVGLLRLRATVTQDRGTGERTLAQRSIVAQRPAPSADARGGVRAMTAAADAAVQDLEHWLDAVSQP